VVERVHIDDVQYGVLQHSSKERSYYTHCYRAMSASSNVTWHTNFHHNQIGGYTAWPVRDVYVSRNPSRRTCNLDVCFTLAFRLLQNNMARLSTVSPTKSIYSDNPPSQTQCSALHSYTSHHCTSHYPNHSYTSHSHPSPAVSTAAAQA
jgi:hypothetical protein